MEDAAGEEGSGSGEGGRDRRFVETGGGVLVFVWWVFSSIGFLGFGGVLQS